MKILLDWKFWKLLAVIWGFSCNLALMISWVVAFIALSARAPLEQWLVYRDEGDFLFAFKVFMIASAIAFLLYVAYLGFRKAWFDIRSKNRNSNKR